MKREVDIVLLSDVHLGTRGCKAGDLLLYLNSIKPRNLILNGDLIDMWSMRKYYFPQQHLCVIQRILQLALQGTKVYYITGNEDDLLRRYAEVSAGNIHLRNRLIVQLNGKKYGIFHGDIFDTALHYLPLLSRFSNSHYDRMLRLNRWINKWRLRLRQRRMSIQKRLKTHPDKASRLLQAFEKMAVHMALEEEFDYIICGHVHRPEMRVIQTEEGQVTYLNAGDWLQHRTALEYNWGKWTIYEFDESDYQTPEGALEPEEVEKVLKEVSAKVPPNLLNDLLNLPHAR